MSDYSHRDGWKFVVGSNGKPYAVDADGVPGPYFSLSHTKGSKASVYAISKTPIGVDIERWIIRDFNTLAGYAFGPREQQEVNQQGQAAFYRIWTIREAMSKVDGKGLAAVIDGVDRANDLKEGLQKRDGLNIFYSADLTDHSLAVVYAGNISLDEINIHVYAYRGNLTASEEFLWAIQEGSADE